MRKVLTCLALILSVIFAIAGAGILNSAILQASAGQNNRYAQSAGVNIHDSYYTLDILGLIRVPGVPDMRIGWALLALSLILAGGVVVSFVRVRDETSYGHSTTDS